MVTKPDGQHIVRTPVIQQFEYFLFSLYIFRMQVMTDHVKIQENTIHVIRNAVQCIISDRASDTTVKLSVVQLFNTRWQYWSQ